MRLDLDASLQKLGLDQQQCVDVAGEPSEAPIGHRLTGSADDAPHGGRPAEGINQLGCGGRHAPNLRKWT